MSTPEPAPASSPSPPPKSRLALIAIALFGGVLIVLIGAGLWTAPTRASLRTLSELMALDPDDPVAEQVARTLCSDRFLSEHELRAAREGGWVGVPRSVSKNFRVWRRDGDVWIRPSDRTGPVYRFVREDRRWKFDGLVAVDRGRGNLIDADSDPDPDRR